MSIKERLKRSRLYPLLRTLNTIRSEASGFLTDWFYGFADRSVIAAKLHEFATVVELRREAAGVAAGKRRYRADRGSSGPTSFLLRRNVHRIEKGLIMKPRRKSFASDYIGQTVERYAKTLQYVTDAGGAVAEVLWAHDTLRAYFQSVEDEAESIKAARAAFNRLASPPDGQAERRPMQPYKRDLDQPLGVSFDDFVRLSKRRRSVRWFLDRPVPRELVDAAVEAASQAPSACNRQPFVFRVFDERTKVRELISIPVGTRGFGHQVPGLVVVVGRLRAYPMSRDRHLIYVDAALTAMSFMLAMETLGLGTCALNWVDQEPQESLMRDALGLQPDERVIMSIAYGWPDPHGEVPYSAKRPLSQLRTYNE